MRISGRRSVALTGLAAFTLGLAACSGNARGTGQPTSSGLDVSKARLQHTRTLTVEHADSLSPDGTRVAFSSGSTLCVAKLDGSARVCPKQHFDPRGGEYGWSPDSRHLAVTEDYFRDLREPDIWVVDVNTGQARDLTDDGVDHVSLSDSRSFQGAHLDYFPSWSPDGKQIRFLRQDGRATSSTVESVPVGGGKVTSLGRLPQSLNQTSAFALDADGRHAAWAGVGDHAVQIAALPGGSARQVLHGTYSAVAFSPDGTYLLADNTVSQYAGPSGDAQVVNVDSGNAMAVAQGSTAVYPTWAPHSSALAFLQVGHTGPEQLRLVAKPGGTARVIYTGRSLGAQSRLSWSGSTILAYASGKPILLTLGG